LEDDLYKNAADEKLMALIATGQVDAFDALYKRYSRNLFHYFTRMLNNDRQAAEDALQDLFLKIVNNPSAFNTDRSFKTWIFSIAHNTCKNYYRHQSVVLAHREHEIQSDLCQTSFSPDFFENIDKHHFQQQLAKALDKLSPEKREVFLLRFQEEYSIAEIAEIQNCPEGSVKSRLHYALKTLEAELRIFKPVND